jgi:hypothetical protein
LLTTWKRCDAFSLVELLCAILLGSVIAGSAIGILAGCIQSYEQALALTEARRRGEMVLQILRLPVENTGLGIPSTPEAFKSSLCIGKASLTAISNWQGPVSISGNELRLVYAIPTSTVNEAPATETMPSEDRSLRLSALPQAGQVEPWSGVGPSKTRSWVIFAPSPCPFLVTALSKGTLSVRSAATSWIPHNGTLHYLRGMRAIALRFPGQEPAFYTEDMSTGSGLQERVLGITGLKAEFEPATRQLSIRVLSRGGKRHTGMVSPSILPGWPGPVSSEDRHYVLAVTSWSCRIRNGGESL